jgi:hypothetical protein
LKNPCVRRPSKLSGFQQRGAWITNRSRFAQ